MTFQQNHPYTFCPLHRIPSEVWEEIIEILATERNSSRKPHVIPFSRTCRAFHGLATPVIYRDITWHTRSINPANVQKTRVLSKVMENNPWLFKLVRTLQVFGDGDLFLDGGTESLSLPLERFTRIRGLRFQETPFTSETLLSISTLPMLQELSLSECSFSTRGGLPLLSTYQYGSVRELNLELLDCDPAWDTFLAFFPRLRRLALKTFAAQTSQIMRSHLIHHPAATLTSLTVTLSTEEMATTFASVLNTAPELETIDIGFSTVCRIPVHSDAVPLLNTYRGPICLAGPFIKDRNVHNVTLCQLWDRREDLDTDMRVLAQSSSMITSLSFQQNGSWTEKLSTLLLRYAREVRILEISCTDIEDLKSWPDTLLPKLSSLEIIRCPGLRSCDPEGGQGHGLMLDWGRACAGLRQISFARSQWDQEGPLEWTGSHIF